MIEGQLTAVKRQKFEQAAMEHLDALYRMAMQLSRHPDEASDLVQETYLRAFRVAEGFEEKGGGIRPWLFKILHNAFYTRMGRAKRAPATMGELPPIVSGDPAPGGPSPAWDLETFDWEQVDGKLKSAIDRLRPEYRSALLLWGVEGLRYNEIAEIQDIPIGTVMSRLHRARRILVEQLSGFVEETGVRDS